ncbi:protein-associating with the carboxyl-terminal domain of ezrin [Bicyclus anynana]|uniref:Protein-associating with the carboxyl-terminal domain of ezrin n=1 Tax=Bicyclus anynana TaxID=110368 RepID=A0A6J1P374_BICAN|nr:protein-associating with the carboxyl-terminal domain of ezrin [Bicyclus anynana]
MGNENSQLNSLEIEEKATELTDFWAHHQATISDSCRYFSLKSDGSVSVFKGETILGPLWTASTPLEKFSNNLLKYRHPCIVRYISSWQQRSTFHLATEFVQPLAQVLCSQTPLQICIGLNNILQALVFLHEQAGMSHNNISIASIYISGDGQWKLAGLQYLCPFSELNAAYLKHSRIHRYDKAVDPNEDSYEITTKVDQFAFAVLVEDVFKGHNDDEVPHLREFKKYCSKYLQNSNPELRPNLSEVLKDNFFNHEFISIYKFLNVLPLKTEEEKSEFFSSILSNLKCYDEVTVAKQLGGLLLSRLTLLDQTAHRDVLPFLLKPKNDRSNGDCMGFFTLSVFKEHVKPRLLQLFGVRDSQIRMLLLSHFTKFIHVFTHEELSQHILPELLVGIKDTDDSLVASTLLCLSELVPILGADTVVGGKRSKLFTDGRPKSKPATLKSDNDLFVTNKTLSDFHCSERMYSDNTNTYEQNISLNERPSPVGGESNDGHTATELNRSTNAVSEDEWDDWENTNPQLVTVSLDQASDFLLEDKVSTETNLEELVNVSEKTGNGKATTHSTLMHKAALEAKKNIVDISDLDIKNLKVDLTKNDEIDFFADMMPVIEKQKVVSVNDNATEFIHKLNFVPDEGEDENEAWGENWNE